MMCFLKGRIKIFLAVVMILLSCVMSSCGSTTLRGTYVSPGGSWVYVFSAEEKNAGSFEIYENGEKVGDEGRRYVNKWTLEEDILTMTRNDDEWYFKVYGDVLVEISDKDEEPDMAEYIAPSGKTFNWKYGHYEFYEDGTVYDSSGYYHRSGNYYVKDNIIYVKLGYVNSNIYYEPEYEPYFYIYNGDYIAYAWEVYIKK